MPLIFDSTNPRAIHLHRQLAEHLQLDKLDPNLFVVIGGDGFMLRSVRQHQRAGAVFLGLNCGHLGFLLNQVPAELPSLLKLLQGDRFRIETFPRIRMTAIDRAGRRYEAVALNDIYLERMTGQTCRLRVKLNGMVVVDEMACDGLILCTALGSTAYNFSAGGVACHPSLSIIGVTPICPHVPKLPPLLFPLSSHVVTEVLDDHHRRVRAVADGVEFNDIVSITVQDAGDPIALAFFPDHHFTATLVEKILRV